MVKKLTIFEDKSHTFVIAEAGSNWKVGNYKQDLAMAKKLIREASKAGADAIKFQTFKSKTIYAHNAGKVTLHDKKTVVDINELFDKLSMEYKMIKELSKNCKKYKIMFMSTPFSIDDAKELNPYVDAFKIASFEINHIPLLQFVAKTKKPIIISTGASSETEIKFVIDLMKKAKSGKVILLQCTSMYPCPFEELNLATIPEMEKKYNLTVGFSDHSIDPLIGPITAVGFGAKVIEKHFTINKSLPGPDHFFAVNPNELKNMVEKIRHADKSKGSGEKQILPVENDIRKFAMRSIQAIKDIEKNDVLKLGHNFDVLRPGKQKRGEEARYLDKIEGRITKRKIKRGEGIFLKNCK
jgi:N,N'-diacetyllegionaminate synthase